MIRTSGLRWTLMALAIGGIFTGGSLAAGRETPSRALLRMHDDFVLAFIDSQGFGQSRLPPMSRVMSRKVDGTNWFVGRLELIGVAKHDPPRVFDSEMAIFHRPNSERPPQPRAANSRAMTAWERQALRDLDAGQRLIVEKQEAGLRVVGAIRAGDECLGCHKKKRAGDMLGAFVYSLWPIPVEKPVK